ncbi:MAG: hypothetical protein JXR32_00855 [Anaerolineaceae bacterium]|nr:hypothetical protein [Anaerolineaceae bacterium]
MKIITNDKLISRNKKISKYSIYAAMASLALAFYFTWRNDTASMLYSLIALFIGLLIWQISMHYTSRWGAKVCPYELVSSALKGLDDKYTLYHYTTPVSHLLVSPSALWVIDPILAGGRISYQNGKWKQKGGNLFFKFFAQDTIGRPDSEINFEIRELERAFIKYNVDIDRSIIKPLILFFNQQVELDLDKAPVICLPSTKAKEYLRKQPKNNAIPSDLLQRIRPVITVNE